MITDPNGDRKTSSGRGLSVLRAWRYPPIAIWGAMLCPGRPGHLNKQQRTYMRIYYLLAAAPAVLAVRGVVHRHRGPM